MQRKLILTLMTLALAAAPVLAGGPRLGGWGPRVGLAADPDQAIGGFHWDLGKVHSQLRFVPNVQVGFGDDHTILEGTAPVHWMFNELDAGFTPYAGGGLAIAWVDRDDDNNGNGNGNDDDSDVELALKATGGFEWRLGNGPDFFVELSLVIGDIHDFQAVAGWTFRSRGRKNP